MSDEARTHRDFIAEYFVETNEYDIRRRSHKLVPIHYE